MIPDNLVPLVYLIVIAAIAAGLTAVGVSPEMAALIVGAGITRVKVSTSTPVPTSVTSTATQTTTTATEEKP
jgi:hypothetical protein